MRLVDDHGVLLDAEFDIEPVRNGVDIILHSRSGGAGSARHRNPDYFRALETLLARLASIDAQILSIAVDSRVARELPVDHRVIDLIYPLRPSREPDLEMLRRRITEGQRTIASRGTPALHRGNNHKRIRIMVDLVTDPTDMRGFLDALRAEGATPDPGTRVYRPATPDPTVRPADLFTFDPQTRERALAAHAGVQNGLAEHVESIGFWPFSPTGDEPDFDLAWRRDNTLYVAEVKSLSGVSATHQLRLGLGQVLQYRTQLRRGHADVVGVLAVEFDPGGAWQDTCAEVDIVLTWPSDWPRLAGC
jgi:hypothetical protein